MNENQKRHARHKRQIKREQKERRAAKLMKLTTAVLTGEAPFGVRTIRGVKR